MSQLTLTAKEDQLVLDSVRARHAQYLSAYSVDDPDLAVLLDKIQSQLTPVAVAEPEAVVETPKAKKTKVVEE
jgi:hypothetical protein